MEKASHSQPPGLCPSCSHKPLFSQACHVEGGSAGLIPSQLLEEKRKAFVKRDLEVTPSSGKRCSSPQNNTERGWGEAVSVTLMNSHRNIEQCVRPCVRAQNSATAWCFLSHVNIWLALYLHHQFLPPPPRSLTTIPPWMSTWAQISCPKQLLHLSVHPLQRSEKGQAASNLNIAHAHTAVCPACMCLSNAHACKVHGTLKDQGGRIYMF